MRKIADITLLTLVVNMALLAHGVREVRGNDMDGFKDNFFSYMYGANAGHENPVMDAQPNGYIHPNGEPCRAKRIENCPVFQKEQHEMLKEDDLSPVAEVQRKSTEGEYEGIRTGSDPESPNVRAVRIDECDTFKVGSTKSKYREARNRAFEELMKRKANGENVDGTYPLSNPTHKVTHTDAKGEEQDGFASGWQVSFQTTNGEGFNPSSGKRMTDEQYDATVEELQKETGSKPYLGVFGDIPEISFRVKSMAQAMKLAKKYNQVSIANNKRIAAGIFDAKTFPMNLDYDWRGNQVFVMK